MTSSCGNYETTWPETVVFWGAGATAALQLPTTVQIGSSLCWLAKSHPDGKPLSLRERVKKAFPKETDTDIDNLVDLLLLLGDREASPRAPGDRDPSRIPEVYRRHFDPKAPDDQAIRGVERLRGIYDWGTLSEIIRLCPAGDDPNNFQLIDLFNMIDMHLASHHGFRATPEAATNDANRSEFISPESLLPARNALKMLTCLMTFLAWRRTRSEKADLLAQYIEFTQVLTRMMQREGLELLDAGFRMDRREFYLFSYAVISLNWDPILMWLIFDAHRVANNDSAVPHVGVPALPMKLFHDLAHFLGVRRVESKEPLVWYPGNETAAQRLNDVDHVTDRRIRVGKFYFPHGCLSFRECPNCGKLIVNFGDTWSADSETLFPPPLLRCFSKEGTWEAYRRCAQERKEFERGHADFIVCSFCGAMTEARHTPLIMQSSIKGSHPPFLEEIQRDMRVALEKAKHVVLLGYSLPPDDFLYRAILSARKNRKPNVKCSIVNRGDNAENRWLSGDALRQHREDAIRRHPMNQPTWTTTVEQAQQVFGKDNIRLNLCGIPAVFSDGGGVSERSVRELLYPSWVFEHSIAQGRKAPVG